MRVLLVNTNTLTSPYPVPPLGLCLVAESLAHRHEVELYDGTFQGAAGLAEAVARLDPEAVGIGLRNVDDLMLPGPGFFVDEVGEQFVRPLRAMTRAPLVLGGSGFSLLPGPLLERLGCDYGVVGPGERALPRLLDLLAAGAGVSDVAAADIEGVATRAGAVGRAAAPAGLEPVPCGPGNVDRWLDFEPYRKRGSYPLQTRRGCAQRCVYCTYPLLEGRRYRPRDATEVADEVQGAAERLGPGVTFEFVDSTFNAPRGHAEAVCREIARRGLGVRLRTMGVNPAGADEELFSLMRAAGFAQIDCTPDSASPAMLRNLGKSFSLAELERCAAAIRALDLPTMWFFLLGGPGEDERTLEQTRDFILRRVSPEDMVYMAAGLRVYPGTPLHSIALAQGTVLATDDLLYPRFFVSPALGERRLISWVQETCAALPNCVPAWDTRPPPEMLARAMRLRVEQGLDEPVFRTLIRLRREELSGPRG